MKKILIIAFILASSVCYGQRTNYLDTSFTVYSKTLEYDLNTKQLPMQLYDSLTTGTISLLTVGSGVTCAVWHINHACPGYGPGTSGFLETYIDTTKQLLKTIITKE